MLLILLFFIPEPTIEDIADIEFVVVGDEWWWWVVVVGGGSLRCKF